jgi:hypothetical protein
LQDGAESSWPGKGSGKPPTLRALELRPDAPGRGTTPRSSAPAQGRSKPRHPSERTRHRDELSDAAGPVRLLGGLGCLSGCTRGLRERARFARTRPEPGQARPNVPTCPVRRASSAICPNAADSATRRDIRPYVAPAPHGFVRYDRSRRAAALSVHFEADDLFVLAHVEGFGSFDEARRALASGPGLSFDGGWIAVVCPGRAPRRLCPYDNDECGRWPAAADRSSHEDSRAAQLSIPAFMAFGPDAALFRATWAAVRPARTAGS